jgi:hypothetical protein
LATVKLLRVYQPPQLKDNWLETDGEISDPQQQQQITKPTAAATTNHHANNSSNGPISYYHNILIAVTSF